MVGGINNEQGSTKVPVLICLITFVPVLGIRIHRNRMFLGLQDPNPLVRGMDPDPDPSLFS